jgi:hypothetical protein
MKSWSRGQIRLRELDLSSRTTLSCDWTSAVIQKDASLVGAMGLDSMVAVTTDRRTPSLVANLMTRRNVNIGPSKQDTADTTLARVEAIVSVAEAQSLCVELESARLQ